jgi:hypothetical protein
MARMKNVRGQTSGKRRGVTIAQRKSAPATGSDLWFGCEATIVLHSFIFSLIQGVSKDLIVIKLEQSA